MKQIILHIDAPDGVQTITLGDELTIGRTDASGLILGDQGLSRKNTTFFRDGDEALVVDESSLNGTFLNGTKLTGGPAAIRNGDIVTIGSGTKIQVEFPDEVKLSQPVAAPELPPQRQDDIPQMQPPKPAVSAQMRRSSSTAILAAVSIGLTLAIITVAIGLIVLRPGTATGGGDAKSSPTPRILTGSRIPMRVIDPLGSENEDDLDDLIASWETSEKEIDASTVSDVAVNAADKEESDLNVPASLLADRQKKAMEPRNAETGIRPGGLNVPKELYGDGVIKQKAKLREMNKTGYRQPMDFADLAQKRLNKELIEMPMASQSYYLDVGGSASDGPFQSFAFPNVHADIPPGDPKYDALAKLAADFSGQKYDLNNPADRKQMRVRLLRMFNPRAKAILIEIADAYFQKFGRPLRVTSLTRSMDYQIGLNATNANSFQVRGEGSLPPHTSGCAFDLARKQMTAEEQNFVMQKLAQMENANKLDALIEYNVNACFHIFIYFDGVPPKM